MIHIKYIYNKDNNNILILGLYKNNILSLYCNKGDGYQYDNLEEI